MPELPEVETVRKGLENRLLGFQISKIEVCRERAIASPGGSSEFISNLIGAKVGSWKRRGKYLIATLHRRTNQKEPLVNAYKDGGHWGVHLRMTGQFQWHNINTTACQHTRVRFWNNQGQELRFVDTRSFGQMWWVPPGISPDNVIQGLRRLGPEPFSKDFNAQYLEQQLKGKKRPIKSALLDQSIIAGAGNIYSDESLFSAGILPNKPSGDLKRLEIEKLCLSLVEVLKISIGVGGTTFSDFRNLEGINGQYGGQAWVYRRNNKPCRICGTKIERTKISGRSTHWCPNCQC